ncbi:MAG: autotransporter strand-loop-strand O-heptosyltransferase [Selenomonadaceae bacterium]|nr:autotransporter strand-loop-strand O-heptosyltransferase [Selenomonadaceae bacterium]
MKNFFFCARNLEDYLAPLINATEKKLVDIHDKNLLTTKDVQSLFRSIINTHLEGLKYFDTPISDVIVTGLQGVKLDFNFGLRLEVPEGNWRVRIIDFDSGIIFFDKYVSDVRLSSLEFYYIHWKVELFLDDEKVFSHTLDLENKQVLMNVPRIGMGDVISMLPYIEEFRRKNNCEVSIILPDYLREFTAYLYPELKQVGDVNYKSYAAYHIPIPSDILPVWSVDMRNYPLGRIVGVALGLNTIAPKKIFEPTMSPLIDDPYVCIAVQASHPKKGWFYPKGWDIIIDYLKSLGYRVLCIDRHQEVSDESIKICKPDGAEDVTGNFSIMHRANMLYYAEFFIGLSSGIAWIADAVGCPVVMICGFSQDWFEFYTPYRVANRLVCNGCLTDLRVSYMKQNCPYHEGTPREFECQKKISPRQVMNAIEQLIINEKLKPPILRQ